MEEIPSSWLQGSQYVSISIEETRLELLLAKPGKEIEIFFLLNLGNILPSVSRIQGC